MPRTRTEGGGYRPGGGRPPSKPRGVHNPLPKDIVKDAKAAGMQPLEYMLAVMNDPTADLTRRDRMAIAAAPFCHARYVDIAETGKKAQARVAAKKPDAHTSLGGLMGERMASLAN